MIDFHEEIIKATSSYQEALRNTKGDVVFAVPEADFYDLASDILKLVNDNYISKQMYNNVYKEGNWR